MIEKQKTLVIIKPGAFKRRQAGLVLTDIQTVVPQLAITDIRLVRLTQAQAEAFYVEQKGRGHYDGLIAHTTSGPSLAIVLEGVDAIKKMRDLVGPTDPTLGTAKHHLRAKYGWQLPDNGIHASDSVEACDRELDILFAFTLYKLENEPVTSAEAIKQLTAALASMPDVAPGKLTQGAGTYRETVSELPSESAEATPEVIPGSSDTAGG